MSYVRGNLSSPVIPSVQEAALARLSCTLLIARLKKGPVTLHLEDNGEMMTLPASATRVLIDMLTQMADGKGVSVVATDAELTTQQAADLLGVSRPYFVRLLGGKEIPHRTVGTHRRVFLKDVLEYMEKDIARREATASELTKFSQKIGLAY